jgi:predicted TIM-barrel fold metal-dependent hydrolase
MAITALAACQRTDRPLPSEAVIANIIDTHAHIHFTDDDAVLPTQPRGTEALQQLDDQAHVTQSALIVIAQRGQVERTRQQNDAVIAAAAASHGRFFPVASVHPLDGQAAFDEMARVAALGVRVIKLHPNSQNFDVADPAVAALAARAGALHLILLFDSYKPWDASEIGKFLMLSVQNPNTRFILAHMGWSQFRETLAFAQLRRLGIGGNVWFDLSAIAPTYADSPLEPELVWTIRQIGTERLLFGSDWPVYTPAESADAVRRLGFTPAEQRQIFHDNAAALLGVH